jgi:hypothetical protein
MVQRTNTEGTLPLKHKVWLGIKEGKLNQVNYTALVTEILIEWW